MKELSTQTVSGSANLPGAAPNAADPLVASIQIRTREAEAATQTWADQDARHSSETRTQSTAEPEGQKSRRADPPRPRRQRLLMFLSGSLALLAIYGGWRWYIHALTWVSTDNAFISAHIHQVSSRVAGTVQEVLVKDNEWVQAGALLARLDPRDSEVRVQEAEAQLAQAQAQVQTADAEIAHAHAQLAREQAQATKAERDLERARTLFEGKAGAISKQEFDAAQANSDAAQATLKAAQSAVGATTAKASAARAQLQAAEASLKNANLQLTYTEIRAPASGRIGRKNLETGNRVQPGQALVALVQRDIWVIANFKETQLHRLKPAQSVNVQVDAFPGRVFAGHVESLSPASGAQFALLPPDNATGNFTKIVQRVPVKVVLEPASIAVFEDRIVPGMSALVSVKVRP